VFRSHCQPHRKHESRYDVNRCGASGDRLQIGGEVSRTETVGGVRRSRQDCE